MERSGSSPGLNLQNRVCQANSDCSSACLCKSPNLFRARPFWQRCLMDVASIMYFSITRAIFSFLAHWHLICAMSSLYYCQIPLTPFHLVSYIELVDLYAPPPLILECSHLRWWRSFCFFLYLISYGVIGGCRVPLVSGRPSAGGSEGWGRGWWAEREREKMKENNFRSKLIWNRKEQKSEAQKTRRKSPIISCCYHNIKTKMIWFHFLRLFHSCIFIVFFLCVCFVLVQVSRRVGLTEGGGD